MIELGFRGKFCSGEQGRIGGLFTAKGGRSADYAEAPSKAPHTSTTAMVGRS